MTGERFLSSMEDALLISLGDQAAKDPSLIVLAMGNRDEALCSEFAREHPEQFIYTGLSARDTVLLAAGLSLSGRNVIVHGQSSLLVTRAFDAIRTAVAIPSLPVRFLLARSGLTGGADGTTFQILEDLALLRSLPNLSILVPSDGRLAVTLLEGASGCKGPVFFRLSSFALPEIDRPAGFDFQPGGAPILREGDGVTLCACGTMVHEALKASNILSQQGIEAEVIDCYSVKPLPAQAITLRQKNGMLRRCGGTQRFGRSRRGRCRTALPVVSRSDQVRLGPGPVWPKRGSRRASGVLWSVLQGSPERRIAGLDDEEAIAWKFAWLGSRRLLVRTSPHWRMFS